MRDNPRLALFAWCIGPLAAATVRLLVTKRLSILEKRSNGVCRSACSKEESLPERNPRVPSLVAHHHAAAATLLLLLASGAPTPHSFFTVAGTWTTL